MYIPAIAPKSPCPSRGGACEKDRTRDPASTSRGGRNLCGQDESARRRIVADRAAIRQGLHHALGQGPEACRGRNDFHGIAGSGHCAGRRRPAARTGHRDLWPGIVRQNHAHFACHCGSAEARRGLRLRRRRTCARPGLCAQVGRQPRRSLDLAAGHRRAGARNHGHARALGRGRRAGGRFGGGLDAARGNRGRDGGRSAGPPGAIDEPGAEKAHRVDFAFEHHGDLHQPDPHEDRRDVWLARDDHRRPGAEVLFLGSPRHPAHRRDQGSRAGGRQSDPSESRQEQGRSRRSSRSSSTSCMAKASRRSAS